MPNLIKCYYDLMSQPARALYMFLNLNQIPFEKCPKSIPSGDHLTEDFRLTVNRFAKFPCIDDNGFRLAETAAIMHYVRRKYAEQVADHWYPASDAQSRARVDEFVSWQHLQWRHPLNTYMFCQYVMPNVYGKSVSRRRLAEARRNLEVSLDFFERDYLEDGRFVATGERISMADLFAISELKQLDITDCNPSEGRPKIQRYIQLVTGAIAESVYDETFAVLHKYSAIVMANEAHQLRECY